MFMPMKVLCVVSLFLWEPFPLIYNACVIQVVCFYVEFPTKILHAFLWFPIYTTYHTDIPHDLIIINMFLFQIKWR